MTIPIKENVNTEDIPSGWVLQRWTLHYNGIL